MISRRVTDRLRKRVYTIEPDPLKAVTVIDHDLGPDVIVQLRSERGRILTARIDVEAARVLVHFQSGVSEHLRLVIIG